MRANIIELIRQAAEETNEQFAVQISKKGAETILFGRKGKLDSIGLVNLVVAVETLIEEEFDVNLTIADERAMSQKHSPFRTVSTLADYIIMLLEEENITIHE